MVGVGEVGAAFWRPGQSRTEAGSSELLYIAIILIQYLRVIFL